MALTMLLSFVGTFSAFAAKIVGQEMGKDGVTYKVIKLKVYNKTEVKEAEVSIVSTGTPKVGQDNVDIPGEVILNVGGKDSQNRDFPQQDITFKVTEIEKVGYGNLNGVKTFNIPASIKVIGEGAFNNAAMEGNTDLKIIFAAGSELETIGDYAFGNCAIKEIDMTNCDKLNLSTGKPFASKQTGENNYLETVKLPKGIQNIGTAFAGIPTLKNLDLSKTSVSELVEGALAGTSIEEVTLPKVIDPTVSTVKIGKGAFPATVKKLTINAPIAAEGAIDPEAFIGMTDLEELILNGELDAEAAIPSNAFPNSSKLNKVIVNGKVKADGAIADNAFADNNNISEVTFSKPILAGGIGQGAFAGIGQDDCAIVNFSTLEGAAAIGSEAFKGAGISELNFNGAIAADAIATYAFQNITCGAVVEFKGTIGEGGIGMYAFENAYLTTLTFDKHIDSEEAISPLAFTKANITAITFKKPIRAKYGVGNYAFFAFTNDKGTTPVVLEDGGIKDNGIGEHAFDKGAVGSLTINGNLVGESAIGAYAFANNPIAEFTLTGEVANTNAIDFGAFAFDTKLAQINLQGNIYTANGGHAISTGAFFGAGTATANGAVLNLGSLKMTAAIEAGAFASAKLNVVNFSRLMAVHAIADNQFGAMNIMSSRLTDLDDKIEADGTKISSNGEAATIKTVNFNEEFKAWQEANNNATNDFIGANAFSNTKVEFVNFNAPVSVEEAIIAESAAKGPFANNGANMIVKFNAGVISKGIGAYAFANSQTVKIELDKDAVYGEIAFRNNSFYAISWTGESGNHVEVTYTPANNSLADRAFAQSAFYKKTSVVDVRFKTTKYVLDLYTEENQETDKTPYRVKFVASKLIDLVWSPTEGKYVGTFSPENEMYAIDKYQGEFEQKPADSRKEVGVWSAYYDGRTLEAQNVPFSSWPARDHYTADLYINPLRVQNHIYYLNPGHTLIVTANFAGPVEATQVLDEDVYGGVQTFGDYNAWQCNDLRYNPAENKEWGGYVNFRAIQDGNTDWYGNRVRDYQLFRQCDYATEGIDWFNTINLPPAQQYLLVTDDKAQRIKYSSYEQNQNWFTGHDVPWEATVAERIEAAVALALVGGYEEGYEDAKEAILAKLNAELDPENQKDNIDDAIAALIDQEADKAAAADEAKTEKIKAAAEALKEAIQ
ncbi:MAG: leucine-rich repeat domain-containing protein, partial [Prevotella sp.]|nr:leucine-rich repeat domain-containing protein [Prevotella sp.]